MCSRECAGRCPGTPESAAARERIVSELARARVEPAGKAGYLQMVPGCGDNILARIPGTGALAERAVVVAAHYDHLGRFGRRDAFWGADDNAAALAILLDLARELNSPGESARQVVLAIFDGEEPPHFLGETMGSVYYAKHPTVPLENTDAMVCMDLVGHTLGPAHFPEGARTARRSRHHAGSIRTLPGVRVLHHQKSYQS